jgi:hypothetical protein
MDWKLLHRWKGLGLGLALIIVLAITIPRVMTKANSRVETPSSSRRPSLDYKERRKVDTAGFLAINTLVPKWPPYASPVEISQVWDGAGLRAIEQIDLELANNPQLTVRNRFSRLRSKVEMLDYEGEPARAYEVLEQLRTLVDGSPELAAEALYTIIYLQGLTALRRGENENCIMCRGESSCILPISPAARHQNPEGSRLAIKHFTEYLDQFPSDLEVRWLLNVAHMTLGEYPDQVESRFFVPIDHFLNNEFDIGRFRDIGHLVGVNQFTQAGGAVMEDFDNDGLLDLVTTTYDPTGQMNLFRNTGKGTFEDQTTAAGLTGQLGGLNCNQTDYNNDGFKDIFVIRGAWVTHPMRPSLLRNNQNGTFTDVTEESGLMDSFNSIAATWADYDNDGWLDLFICCERQQNRLYHNRGNGTFEEVSIQAGIARHPGPCKGANWIDYDNDGYPDLFLNFLVQFPAAQLLHNNRDGTFSEVTTSMGIDGPETGFSCWAWDFDNDGWLDIFASCYDTSLANVVEGLIRRPQSGKSSRLYRNLQGKRFEDVARETGLNPVYSTMGSNFADFDNDGFLDLYLGTGAPDLAMLIPNRMIKNVGGRRFSDITASSGTGNLQKGHGVTCGDWDRDGNMDLFIEMGGAVNGDKYHNILFQNPGHANKWLTVKLTGTKTNRAAIGARIKVVTAGNSPQTIFRHVSSGSSFGANPLQQTIGLGKADRISILEIHWPTSQTTQTFHDVDVNQAIAITEFDTDYQKLDWKPVPVPVSEHRLMMNRSAKQALQQ